MQIRGEMKIDLIVADDHPALVAGIEHALSRSNAIRVMGTASNSTELVDLLACERCDILITDYAMPGGSHGDGLGLLSFLRRHHPDLKIIVFTAIDNSALIASMARLGVRAIVNKMDHIDSLIATVQAVYAGASCLRRALGRLRRRDRRSTEKRWRSKSNCPRANWRSFAFMCRGFPSTKLRPTFTAASKRSARRR